MINYYEFTIGQWGQSCAGAVFDYTARTRVLASLQILHNMSGLGYFSVDIIFGFWLHFDIPYIVLAGQFDNIKFMYKIM